MQRRGIGRQLQRTAPGSTPHDRVSILQISSSRSPPLDRPRRSALRHPPADANPRATCRVRCHSSRIRQPLHRRTTRCNGSIQISQLARGAQIPIAPAATPYVPSSAVSSLGGFRTPTAEYAAPSLMRPASETLHTTGQERRVTLARFCTPHCKKVDCEGPQFVEPPSASTGSQLRGSQRRSSAVKAERPPSTHSNEILFFSEPFFCRED